ncbi:MAG: threonine synthase [Methylorubrum populi]
MLYVSTRGQAPKVGFVEAMLTGLAPDGGLYVPEQWPALAPERIGRFAGARYADVAKVVVGALTGDDIAPEDLDPMIERAYGPFRHRAVCPLVQIDDNLFLVELFHGPTLAFKDVAMRLLGQLLDHTLQARGERATIVGATSGDTGSAAIDAFRGLNCVDVFVLYPQGRVSEVQRRQMTGCDAPNVHAVAVEGTFDDCQGMVKALFASPGFREEIKLSVVNSINWARIAAQAVYYFTAGAALGSPGRAVSFSVPTGNFGDIFAGWAAKRMGLPINRLMIGTNENDILARTLATGTYEVRGVVPTSSPSMDIQVSSNFERLLFEAGGRNAAAVIEAMADLARSGRFTIDPRALQAIRTDFSAESVGRKAAAAEIAETRRDNGYMLDPHSAVGVRAARTLLRAAPATPVVALATAHPAKFPEEVQRASGLRPQLPAHLTDLMERPERITVLPNSQAAVEDFVRRHSRVARERL